MNLNKLKSMAQQQLQDPKRRAQVDKLVTTARTKIADRKPGSKPVTTTVTPPATPAPVVETTPVTDPPIV